MTLATVIDEMVREQARRNDHVLEEACEIALTTGIFGVSVVHRPDGTIDAKVDPDVPFGMVFHYPVAR